ncbi:MAG: 30S ribosomal protein S12 methylthiotransferase RimO [Clostridia bacterium]|nr:30S ribosomal protein S12 methylthiotransferase RimO [Clostridia bacterium]MBQ5770189.1 30S ribosomal protein S12 methylthiotransferase RimO [Clostridia bacterium]
MALKVGMVSLGCSKNRVDSEVLLGILRDNGYEIVADPAEADVVFVNTCGFIEPAKEESIDAIFEMAEYKKTGKLKKLFVTGCLSQRYADALYDEMPEVDGFMGVSDYARTIEMLKKAEEGEKPVFTSDGERFLDTERVLTTPPYTAYIKISDGCDNKCTYCAIPLIRGSYRSRPYDDIITECRQLAAKGVRELVFIAQDTSRYGNDFDKKTLLLPRLLKEASEIEGVEWVRVLYCYPDTVTDELLETIRDNPKICPYLDLPLQHIDDNMLKRMNRRGSSEHIKDILRKVRSYGIFVRSTMIVGFPGETDEQFETLLDFIKEFRFDRLGAFTYSPEEGTPAAEFDDQIDEDVKQMRLDQLMLLQQEISFESNKARIGKKCKVLVEDFEDGYYIGRSPLEAPEIDGVIKIETDLELEAGDFVTVRITDCDAYDLMGVIEK